MASNFWSKIERAGHIDVADSDGNTVRLPLCRDRGRLGIVFGAPAFSAHPGRLTADFGPDNRGFASEAAARAYAERHIS